MSYFKPLTHFFLALAILATYSLGVRAGSPTGTLAKYGESRSWSNDTGKFRIDGKMKTAEGNQVTIAKSDGRVITVPLDKLSQKDQQFVAEFLAAEAKQSDPANPFAGGEPANPFAGGEPATGMSGGNNISGGSSSGIPQKQAVIGGVRPITATPAPGLWDVKPPFPLPQINLQDTIIPMDLPNPFASRLVIGAGGRAPTVILNNYRESHRKEENSSRFMVYDPSTEQISALLEYDEPWRLMAVAPNGAMMAAVRVVGFDKGNDLALFKIEDNQLKPMYWFTAGGGDWDELHWVGFLPGNRLATISQKKNVTIWDLSNPVGPKALFRGSTGGPTTVEMSPAGELMIFPAGKSIAVVDTMNAKLVGWLERDTEAAGIALSSDGRTLAAFHPYTVTLYSMETGAELKQFAVSESSVGHGFRWVGKHLMVGNVVYDIDRELAIWNYQGLPGNDLVYSDFHLAAFGEDKQSTLTIFKLPHAAALAAAANVDPTSVFAMRPGDGVKVVFNMNGAPQQVQQDAQRAVQAKIDELGWVRLDNAVTVMEVTVEQLKQDSQDYYVRQGIGPFFAPPGFGRPTGPKETVSFTPWKHSLVIKVGGKQIYSTGYTRSAPQNLQLKENESAQTAINRIVQPDGNSFKTMKVPPHLLKPEYQGGMGSSRLSKNGLN
ncbi:SHD1 domain-containing protein [Blastopirellula marina]|uniref:SLA1 homology domain-containing protein n=1 Tax=Blastopirellula marina TaxID=124 RepID=A0A2S8G8S9_9BACT|nr:SHD1 domain-containing protein [Blastopirellula marina]PQO40681.1 hypothetical protein C5Y98_05520 [Blastopirellula marina]PTL45641.1 hypothetical protein C5Y97_05520 [Blastopirellula marina]